MSHGAASGLPTTTSLAQLLAPKSPSLETLRISSTNTRHLASSSFDSRMVDPGPASSRVPLEIWIHILNMAVDPDIELFKLALPSIWQTGRRVSRIFKAATEAAYVSKFFRNPDMEMTIDLQACPKMAIESDLYKSNTSIWDWGGGPQQYVVFEFDRLAPDPDHGDGSRAVWKLCPPVHERNEWLIASPRESGSAHCRDRLNGYNFYGVGLDGLVIDYENREVSILWKVTLSKLIAKYRLFTADMIMDRDDASE